MKRFSVWITGFFTLTILTGLALYPAKTAARQGYHNYHQLTQECKQLSRSAAARLESLGKTGQGRDIWMLQVTSPKGNPLEKQGLLITGNLEGDFVIGSEVALGIARHLIQGYQADKEITRILNHRIFYIIPRLNPDGSEYFFKNILQEKEGNLRPRDDDYDWNKDEDGPEDLNGDGMITSMRVKDIKGDWVIDPKDPRIMKKKSADSPLDTLYKIYPEGFDNDGDELYNEDGSGGYNINRNFPHNFGYKIKGSGFYPASEVETRIIMDFMTRYVPKFKTQPRRNICAVLVFSKYDNLAGSPGIECGTAIFPQPVKRAASAEQRGRRFFRMFRRGGAGQTPQEKPREPQPRKTVPSDSPIFKMISDNYKKITGIKHAFSRKPFGSFLEWAYFQYGVPAFSANFWPLSASVDRAPLRRPAGPGSMGNQSRTRPMAGTQFSRRSMPSGNQETASDAQWLKWMDKTKQKGFINWQKYNHKQLGMVEIGGFIPYFRSNPSPEKIPVLSKAHTEFALYLVSLFAEIEFKQVNLKKLSTSLYQLKVTLVNRGKLPYSTAMGRRSRNITPIQVSLKLSNNKKMSLFSGEFRYDLADLKSSEEKDFIWTIISPAGENIELCLWARKGGGRTCRKLELK